MVIVACYLVTSSCVFFIRDFGSITSLFFDPFLYRCAGDQQSYAAENTDERYTRASNQITHVSHHSQTFQTG
jgi:hypothetical protein